MQNQPEGRQTEERVRQRARERERKGGGGGYYYKIVMSGVTKGRNMTLTLDTRCISGYQVVAFYREIGKLM